jgi:dihydrofolate reductase
MKIVVVNHVSMDGVMQAPARQDEDTRHGFVHGGWVAEEDDPAIGEAIGAVMGADFSWLFGHRTYDDLLAHWNAAGGPFKEGLNGPTKYVASSDSDLELPWRNSVLLAGNVPKRVAELRARDGGNLVIMGSGELIRSLIPHGLIDELLLMTHPILLGSGQRIFGSDDDARRFTLTNLKHTAAGTILAAYSADTNH